MEKDELLTIPQAAEALGMKRATVWKLVKTGKLVHAEEAGRFKLIRRSDLEAFRKIERRQGWPKGKPRKSP